ncbi:hypothetical protein SLEP1_g11668 [Rubroshorea leprosula]|nr:hypothetical protein SLEP1_g11668 [Rubroshorea leprosula]
MARRNGNQRNAVIDIGKAVNFTGGLEFSGLTYTVVEKKKLEGKWLNEEVDLLHKITGLKGRISFDGMQMSGSLIKRTSAYIMQDNRLFPTITVNETLMFAADFRLGPIKMSEKKQRVEKLIEQLGLSVSGIGDEGTRGVSGGERGRVSIDVNVIHGPPLLFLDEPTSGLDSTSAHSVIEKVHDIARSCRTVILTIHQPSSRIQLLLDHLIILAREYLIDEIQGYDQSELGVEVLAQFARTGMKPPSLPNEEISVSEVDPTPAPPSSRRYRREVQGEQGKTGGRLALPTIANSGSEFDHSVRSPYNNSMSWSASYGEVLHQLRFTPSRQRTDRKTPNSMG